MGVESHYYTGAVDFRGESLCRDGVCARSRGEGPLPCDCGSVFALLLWNGALIELRSAGTGILGSREARLLPGALFRRRVTRDDEGVESFEL